MQKVQFNYEVWKSHPERIRIQLVTRNGSTVTCFSDDYVGKLKHTHQLSGVADFDVLMWDIEGNFSMSGYESGLDLFMILPEEREMYVPVFKVIYPNSCRTGKITFKHYDTKEDADTIGESLAVNGWEFLGTYKLVKQ